VVGKPGMTGGNVLEITDNTKVEKMKPEEKDSINKMVAKKDVTGLCAKYAEVYPDMNINTMKKEVQKIVDKGDSIIIQKELEAQRNIIIQKASIDGL